MEVEFNVALEVLIFGITTLVSILGLLWKISAWQTEVRLLLANLGVKNDNMENAIRDLNEKASLRTSKIYARFDQLEEKYDGMDKRLVKLETTINTMNGMPKD